MPFKTDLKTLAPKEEGSRLKTAIKWLETPVSEIANPENRKVMDTFAQPGLNESKGSAMAKGFLTGALSGVTPSWLAQLATLPAMGAEFGSEKALAAAAKVAGGSKSILPNFLKSGSGIAKSSGLSKTAIEAIKAAKAPSTAARITNIVGNAPMAATGADQAMDENLPTWRRTLGGVLGTAAAVTGLSEARALRSGSKLASVANKANVVDKQQVIKDEINALKNHVLKYGFQQEVGPETGTLNLPQFANAKDFITKHADHELVRDIFPNGPPKKLGLDQISKEMVKTAKDKFKSEAALDKMKKAAGDADAQIGLAQEAGEKSNFKQLDKDLYDASKASADSEKGLGKAQETAKKSFERRRRILEVARGQADAEDIKRTNAAIAQADAERQANKLAELKEGTVQLPTNSVRESIKGPGEHGGTESATIRRIKPNGDVAEFDNFDDAVKHAQENGSTHISQNDDGKWQVVTPAREQAPKGTVELSEQDTKDLGLEDKHVKRAAAADKLVATAADKALARNRPFGSLSKEEQDNLIPLVQSSLKKAKAEGIPVNSDDLADELANRFIYHREGIDRSTKISVRDLVKRAGGIVDDGSEEMKNFRSFLKGEGINPSNFFVPKNSKGVAWDQRMQNIVGTPGFEDLPTDDPKNYSLLKWLEEKVRAGRGETNNVHDEFRQKLNPDWWRPQPPPEAEVPVAPTEQLPTEQLPTEPSEVSEAGLPNDVDTSFNPEDLEPPAAAPIAPPKAPKGPRGGGSKTVSGFNKSVEDILAGVGEPTPEHISTASTTPQPDIDEAYLNNPAAIAAETRRIRAQQIAQAASDQAPTIRWAGQPGNGPVTHSAIGVPIDELRAQGRVIDSEGRELVRQPQLREPAGPPQEMSPEEFAQALESEGNKPIVPLPEQGLQLKAEEANPLRPDTGLDFGNEPPPTPKPKAPRKPKGPKGGAGTARLLETDEGANALDALEEVKGAPKQPKMTPAQQAIVDAQRAQTAAEAPQPSLTPIMDAAADRTSGVDPNNPIGPVNPQEIANKASVPFMITKKMEADLLAKGVSQETINSMTPQQAWDALNAKPTVPQTGAAPIVDPKTKLINAGEAYGALKNAKTAGAEVPEEARAGAAFNAMNATEEFAQAVMDGTISPDEVSGLPPIYQGPVRQAIKRLVKKLNSQASGRIGNEKGAATLGPMANIAMGGLGAIGGASYDQDDPLTGALVGGMMGLAGPHAIAAAAEAFPGIAGRTGPIIDKGLDLGNKLHNTALLSPLSVVKKASGDIGGLSLASLEAAINGKPEVAGNIIKQLLTQEGRAGIGNAFKSGFMGPDQEAISGLENYITNVKNPLSYSGRTMGGLTQATKHILGEAGLPEAAQKYYTLTAEPSSKLGKDLFNLTRSNRFVQHMVPFARIGINRLERGVDYSPLGYFKALKSGTTTEAAKDIFNRATLGTAVGTAAYGLTPEDWVKEHPTKASIISALGGPLGLTMLAGMAGKTAGIGRTRLNPASWIGLTEPDKSATESGLDMQEAAQEIGRDIPGLRLIEDIQGRSFPTGFARNYLSGYTNNIRPISLLLRPEDKEYDISSKDLPYWQQLLGRMISNLPDPIPEKLGLPEK